MTRGKPRVQDGPMRSAYDLGNRCCEYKLQFLNRERPQALTSTVAATSVLFEHLRFLVPRLS